MTRQEIEALLGHRLVELDALLGTPIHEDFLANGSSGTFEQALRCYYQHGDLCFAIETSSHRTYGYGKFYAKPTREDYSVEQIRWFESPDAMTEARRTLWTNLRSDND